MRSIASPLLVACILGLAAPAAQQSSSPQKFRTSTRLIPISVVVRDSRNRAVAGLKAEDFQVLENGAEVPVSFFAAADDAAAAGTPADVAALADKGQFTNRIQSPAGGGLVAIVFDQLNTTPWDQSYARQHLVSYLRSIRPADRVALYALNESGMRVLYDFTRDAQSLVKALERLDRGDSAAAISAEQQLPAPMLEGLSAFARGSLDRMHAHFAMVRGTTTLEAFEAIAGQLAGVPGRKNIVWVSSGFPFNIGETGPSGMLFSNLRPETRRAARALNHSDTAAYPVDARGLISQSTDPNAPGRVPTLGEVMAPLDGLRAVADWTGGRAFAHTNDLGSAITQAVDDSRQSYVLGYYPENTRWDERFRRIEVKVRRSNLQVRHREGYFALPPDAPPPAARRAAVAAAVVSPLESTGIPIDVTVTAKGTGYDLEIRLDPSAISLHTNNGTWSGELDVAVAQLLEPREFVREADQPVRLSVDAAGREQLLIDGVRFTRTLGLRPEARQVRIIVRDVVTGTTGSVFIDAERIRAAAGRRETLEAVRR